MIRDMDLVREILLDIESATAVDGWLELEVDADPESVTYHVILLSEAGLIEAIDLSTMGSTSWKPRRLTWAGHEFLDAAREIGRWESAKDKVRQNTGGVTFEILKEVLLGLMRRELGGG